MLLYTNLEALPMFDAEVKATVYLLRTSGGDDTIDAVAEGILMNDKPTEDLIKKVRDVPRGHAVGIVQLVAPVGPKHEMRQAFAALEPQSVWSACMSLRITPLLCTAGGDDAPCRIPSLIVNRRPLELLPAEAVENMC